MMPLLHEAANGYLYFLKKEHERYSFLHTLNTKVVPYITCRLFTTKQDGVQGDSKEIIMSIM